MCLGVPFLYDRPIIDTHSGCLQNKVWFMYFFSTIVKNDLLLFTTNVTEKQARHNYPDKKEVKSAR